ncbi:hypothetical protein D3C79_807680 [compost metagenome]
MPDRGTELLAMAWIQPLVGLIDASVGQVRQVTAGLHQVGLAVQVTPDDPHLLAAALTPQVARQLVFARGSLGGSGNLRAQLARREAAVEFAAGDQIEEHGRITQCLFEDKVAGRGNPGELRPTLGRPALER